MQVLRTSATIVLLMTAVIAGVVDATARKGLMGRGVAPYLIAASLLAMICSALPRERFVQCIGPAEQLMAEMPETESMLDALERLLC